MLLMRISSNIKSVAHKGDTPANWTTITIQINQEKKLKVYRWYFKNIIIILVITS